MWGGELPSFSVPSGILNAIPHCASAQRGKLGPLVKELIPNAIKKPRIGLRASTVQGLGSIPGQGTKIPQASHCGQKEKRKESLGKDGSEGSG